MHGLPLPRALFVSNYHFFTGRLPGSGPLNRRAKASLHHPPGFLGYYGHAVKVHGPSVLMMESSQRRTSSLRLPCSPHRHKQCCTCNSSTTHNTTCKQSEYMKCPTTRHASHFRSCHHFSEQRKCFALTRKSRSGTGTHLSEQRRCSSAHGPGLLSDWLCPQEGPEDLPDNTFPKRFDGPPDVPERLCGNGHRFRVDEQVRPELL